MVQHKYKNINGLDPLIGMIYEKLPHLLSHKSITKSIQNILTNINKNSNGFLTLMT